MELREDDVAEGKGTDNPYWHSEGQVHPIDLSSLQSLCFEIFNLFAANRALVHAFETTGDEDPEELSDPANSRFLKLHQELAEELVLEKLLRLCMLLRTYDDIMGQSPHAARYAEHVKKTNGEDIGYLDQGDLTLREACNKVIHAREIRPIYDSAEWEKKAEPPVTKRVWYLDGDIELKGTLGNKEWSGTLWSEPFLETVLERIAFGWGD
jgi:hypothetical protein